MLTIIAVGIIGINIHIYKGSIIEDAYAHGNEHIHTMRHVYDLDTIMRMLAEHANDDRRHINF
tara:strand:+ start:166 stop:354 length:189 start_codon:yes stop_codon:yes gene_type:complete